MDELASSPPAKRLKTGEGDTDASSPSSILHHQVDEILLNIFQYIDVVTLIQKKPVCKKWQRFCTKAIDYKCDDTAVIIGDGDKKKKKVLQSHKELKDAVDKYLPGRFDNSGRQCTPKDAEEIASTYGYPIDKWDVSNIMDFSGIFDGKYHFNEPIGSWDVSNATRMEYMFSHARSFNQDISSWDVSNVTSMKGMFSYNHSFNQDVSTWDVSNVTDMSYMFDFARSFNKDLSSWDVSNVINMRGMFNSARSFNQPVGSWDVSNVTDMNGMFYMACLFNQDLSSWDVTNVNDFRSMFYDSLFNARRLPWFTYSMMHEW